MQAKLSYVFYKMRTSFWFLPTAITLAAILLSQAVLVADRAVQPEWFRDIGGFFQIGPEGSRLLMSTIAGSMMTVTSLVFSLTLIALTMTSSQFGPRLLTSFMQDRVTQVVLGTFLGTFVYALITLGSIHKADEANFVPYVSIATAMVLAIGSFGVLIFFIHHIASSIQADSIIARVTRELNSAIETQFGPARGDGEAAEDLSDLPERTDIEEESTVIRANANGYIQAIDHEGLVKIAREHGLLVWLDNRAGHFIVPGETVALVGPADRVTAELQNAVADSFVVGRTHTMVQDLKFAVNALVEISLRALSPGINDTYTAIACIDNLSAALANALKRTPPSPVLRDGDGAIRVVLNTITFDGLLGSAFNEIRQTAPGNVSVIIRLIEALTRIAPFAATDAHRYAIRKQAEMICRNYKDHVPEPDDHADIERRVERLNAVLES